MSLIWKKKWFEDKTDYWYSAKVPVIGWEYIVEKCYGENNSFELGLFLSKNDSDLIKISSNKYKTENDALRACEKHLQQTFNKFQKLFTK